MPHDPIRPEVREQMNRIAEALGARLPEGMGFVFLVFSFGEGSFMNYISNADRRSMIAALRELIRNLERS